MAFCANCGTAMNEGGSFCGSCGKPASASISAQPALAEGVQPGTKLASNVAGAFAYVLGLITGVIFLVWEPYRQDKFVRFHAMQSVFFSVACLVASVAWSIVWDILFNLSGTPIFIDLPLRLLFSLGIFLLWLFVMFQAFNGREYRIPFIGPTAAKYVT